VYNVPAHLSEAIIFVG